MHSPSLLIVDEPMVGLDPYGAKRIKKHLKDVDSGRTVFYQRTLDVAQEVCDVLYPISRTISLGNSR